MCVYVGGGLQARVCALSMTGVSAKLGRGKASLFHLRSGQWFTPWLPQKLSTLQVGKNLGKGVQPLAGRGWGECPMWPGIGEHRRLDSSGAYGAPNPVARWKPTQLLALSSQGFLTPLPTIHVFQHWKNGWEGTHYLSTYPSYLSKC